MGGWVGPKFDLDVVAKGKITPLKEKGLNILSACIS
jgi:hypothetical protein